MTCPIVDDCTGCPGCDEEMLVKDRGAVMSGEPLSQCRDCRHVAAIHATNYPHKCGVRGCECKLYVVPCPDRVALEDDGPVATFKNKGTGYHGRNVKPENLKPPEQRIKFEPTVPLKQPPAWLNAVVQSGHDAYERGFQAGFAAGMAQGGVRRSQPTDGTVIPEHLLDTNIPLVRRPGKKKWERWGK